MAFESWMTCEPMATDGEITVGHVNDGAARWPGDMTALADGQPFEYAENGETFVAGGTTYVVRDLVWNVVPEGARTLYLNRRILLEFVGPSELEAVGTSLFVNGKMFANALLEEGTYIDPVDFKMYEWK